MDDVGDCDENEETVEDSSKVYCIICEKESSGAHKCSECDNFVHAICGKSTSEGFGQAIVCNICDRKTSIRTGQNNAKNNLKKQAEKMLALSNSKFPPAEIGTSVVVRVPDVDRGRLAPRNVLAVVTQVKSSGLYELGTKNGTLERVYARNEFTIADGNFVNESDVPQEKISLRSASTQSSGSKQGFVFCHCKGMCIDKKCKCRRLIVQCNSKCHSNNSCKNK